MKKLYSLIASLCCIQLAFAQLTGTYTIDNTQAASPTNFTSFKSAIDTLNTYGVGAGGVRFEVPAGLTFTEVTPFITASGNVNDSIIFMKSGTGPNPVILYGGGTSSTAATSVDAIIRISGADYITFDGIDVMENYLANKTNVTMAEYGYLIRNASATNGSHHIVIKNCRVSLSRTGTTLTIGVVQSAATNPGLGVTPTAFTGTNSHNQYFNIIVDSARAGIHLANGSLSILDSNNQVYSTPGDSTVLRNLGVNEATFGVRADNQCRFKVYNVTIRNLQLPGISRFDGIYLNNAPTGTVSSDTCEIFNNRIYDLYRTSTSNLGGTVSAISSNLTANARSVCRIYNNVIYNIQNQAVVTSGRRINGLLIQSSGGSGATHFIDNNTISIGSTNLVYSTACVEVGPVATTNIVLRNNIFANTTGSQSGSAFHYIYYFGNTSNQFYGSNSAASNNLYYIANTINGFIGFGANANWITVSEWKSAFIQVIDNNSKQSNPQLQPDLTVSTVLPTAVESNGTPIAWIPTDLTGAPRNLTTPDLGAYEGNYAVSSFSNDFAMYAVINPTFLDTTGAGIAIVPVAIITNEGVATQTNVPVELAILDQTIGLVVHRDTVYVTIGPSESYTAVFDSFTTEITGTYLFEFTTLLSGDPNPSNDKIIASTYIDNAFEGVYGIGVSQPYPFNTLSNAVQRLNIVGARDSVYFELLDPDYTAVTGEVFPIIIRSYKGLSEKNRLTIRPAAGVKSRISGSTASLIKFEGVDYATLDGSNSGSDSRDLSIEFATNVSSSAAVWITGANQSNGAQQNSIKNCIIKGFPSTNPNDPSPSNWYGIYFGNNTGISSTTGTPAPNNNNMIQNNYLVRFQTAITIIGNSIAFADSGNVVERNAIGDDSIANNCKNSGMNIQNQRNALVTRNTIQGIYNRETVLGTGVNGIVVTNCKATTFSGNRIFNLVQPGNTSGLAFGIRLICTGLNTAGNPSQNIIQNNFISNIRGNMTNPSWSISGICLSGGYGDQVRYNTVYIADQINNLNGGTGGAACFSNGHGFGTSGNDASEAEVVENNIFLMRGISSGSTSVYAVYFKNATTSGTYRNNLYASYKMGTTNNVLVRMGSNYATMAAWQAASGQDAQSITDTVEFISNTDLHLAGNSIGNVNLIAAPLVSVPTDIDGDIRNTLFPYKGADENTLSPLPVNWLSFSGKRKDRSDVELNWKVVETNNRGFEVQWSTTGRNFEMVTFVPSLRNTSAEAISYAHVHKNSYTGSALYYRIKQIDMDGKTSYSKVIRIDDATRRQNLSIQPNPALPGATIQLSELAEPGAEVTIYSMEGRIVSVGRGEQLVAPTEPGVYVIHVEGSNSSYQKLIVQ